jgi:hypothetical protein
MDVLYGGYYSSIATDFLFGAIPLAASILLCIGLFGKDKLFAIGCFIFAGSNFISLVSTVMNAYYMIDVVTGVFKGLVFTSIYVIIGLHFILKGKIFNSLVKMILGIVHGALLGLFALIAFARVATPLALLNNLFVLVRVVFMTMILIFFDPYKAGAN